MAAVNVLGSCFLMCFGAELISICSRLPLTAPYWPDSFLRISHWVSLQNSEHQKKKRWTSVFVHFSLSVLYIYFCVCVCVFKAHCVVLIYAGKWAFGSTRAHSDVRLTSAAQRLSRSLQQRWCLPKYSIPFHTIQCFLGLSVSDILHTMMDVSLSTESSNISSELRLSLWLKRLLDLLVSDIRAVMVPSLTFSTGPADALRSTLTSLSVSEPAECLCTWNKQWDWLASAASLS